VAATVVNTDVPARIGAHVFLADQVDIGGGHIVYQLKLAGGGGGGVTDHALLTNLDWVLSGHTGTASTVAVFDAGGLAAFATTTGTGTVVVMSGSPTIVTPTIASFVNATHNHQSAAGGGLLDASAISTGTFPIAQGGTNSSAALNNNRVMVSSGGAIVEAAALTDGQVLIGSTGAAPVAGSFTAGTGISIGLGAGTITITATAAGTNKVVNFAMSPYTVLAGEQFLMVDTSAGPVDINLPSAATDRTIAVADTQGTFAVNACTLIPNGADKILNVAANRVLLGAFFGGTFRSDSTLNNWARI
jgi:hypothetical protein